MNCVANRPNLHRLREAVETGTVLLLWEGRERPTCLNRRETFATEFKHIESNVTTRSVTDENKSWTSSVSYVYRLECDYFPDRWSPKIQGR